MNDRNNVIYCMKSRSTERILYVGQSTCFDKRVKTHQGKMMRGTHRADLVEWVSSHGIDDIAFIILESCESKQDLDFLEMKWFYSLNPMSFGKKPGLSSWEMTEDTKAKIRATARASREVTTHKHICAHCGCSFTSRKRSQSYCSDGCRADARKFVFDDEDLVIDMYLSGMSLRDIGDFFGTSRNKVSRLLKERSVQLRKNTVQPKYSKVL